MGCFSALTLPPAKLGAAHPGRRYPHGKLSGAATSQARVSSMVAATLLTTIQVSRGAGTICMENRDEAWWLRKTRLLWAVLWMCGGPMRQLGKGDVKRLQGVERAQPSPSL
jgi:hypothetical protein